MTSDAELARTLADFERRLKGLESGPQLRHSSLDDATLPVYDNTGTLRQTVGLQDDGAYTILDHNGPPPPAPSTPAVTPDPNGLVVEHDGATFDGRAWPTDLWRIEVHVDTAGPVFLPTDRTHMASIIGTKGGKVTVGGLDPDATYYVCLVASNTSRVDSDPSGFVTAVTLARVSSAELEVVQQTADGKNSVYYNNDEDPPEPPAGGHKVNDLWFVADLDNQQRRWNGLDWVVVPLGNNALGDLAADKIVTGTLDAARIGAGTITGEQLAGSIVLGSTITAGTIDQDETSETYGQITGQRVELSTAGIRLVDATGQDVVTVPTDADQPPTFRGQVITDSLRVLGGTSIESQNNEVAKDGSLMLSKGTATPVQGPSLVNAYDTTKFDTTVRYPVHDPTFGDLGTFAFDPSQVTAFGWDSNWGCWLVAQARSGGTRVWRFANDGSVFLHFTTGRPWIDDMPGWSVSGLTVMPGSIAFDWIGLKDNLWWIVGRLYGDPSTGVQNRISIANKATTPTIGYDVAGGYYMVAETQTSDDTVAIRRVRLSSTANAFPATVISNNLAPTTGRNGSLASIHYGTYDFGSSRYLWTAKGGYQSVWAATSSGAIAGDDAWTTPQVGMKGFGWDGSTWCSLGPDGTLYRYSNWTWTDTTQDKLFAGITWYDSDPAGVTPGTHETDLGMVTGLTRKKRAKIQVTLPAVPDKGGADDPDRWRLYTALASDTPPAADQFHLQATGVGITPATPAVLTLTGVDTTSAAPPATNNFPGANPARLFTAGVDPQGQAVFDVMGSGGGRTGGYYWNDDGSNPFAGILTTNLDLTSTTLTDVPPLGFDAVAGGSYLFLVCLRYDGNNFASDLNVTFTQPGGTLTTVGVGPNASNLTAGTNSPAEFVSRQTTNQLGDTLTSTPYGGSTSSISLILHGSFVCAVSGRVQLQAAQNNPDATPMTINLGSFLKAERIA